MDKEEDALSAVTDDQRDEIQEAVRIDAPICHGES
jgi:hypothetical protein